MQMTINRRFALALASLLLGWVSVADGQPVIDYSKPDLRANWHTLVPVFTGEAHNPKADQQNLIGKPNIEGLAVDKQGASYAICNTRTGTAGKRKYQTMLVKCDASGTRVWQRPIGDEKTPATAFQLTLDAKDNVYVAGWTSIRIGAQPSNGGLAISFTSDGRQRWSHNLHLKDVKNNSGYWALAVDDQSVCLVGTVTTDLVRDEASILITRLSLEGRPNWSQKFETEQQTMREPSAGITITPKGTICALGVSSTAFIPGARDISRRTVGFVVATDGRGRKLWRTELGLNLNADIPADMMTSVVRSIDHDKDGNLYVVGSCSPLEPMRLDPRVRRNFPAAMMKQHHIFIAKLSERGELLWTRSINEVHNDPTEGPIKPQRVRVAPSGEVYVYGEWNKTPAMLRMDDQGKPLSFSSFAQWRMYDPSDFDFAPDGRHAIIFGQYVVPEPQPNGGLFVKPGEVPRPVTTKGFPPHFFVAEVNLNGPEPVAPGRP